MDFTISALAAERVADLRRDVPPPLPPGRPRRNPLHHLLRVGRLRTARAAASPSRVPGSRAAPVLLPPA